MTARKHYPLILIIISINKIELLSPLYRKYTSSSTKVHFYKVQRTKYKCYCFYCLTLYNITYFFLLIHTYLLFTEYRKTYDSLIFEAADFLITRMLYGIKY